MTIVTEHMRNRPMFVGLFLFVGRFLVVVLWCCCCFVLLCVLFVLVLHVLPDNLRRLSFEEACSMGKRASHVLEYRCFLLVISHRSHCCCLFAIVV